MKRLRLIHWNKEEAKQQLRQLRQAGYRVTHLLPDGLGFLKQLRDAAPDAVIIDLSRLPTQGRDVALAIREQKATRHLPLIFAGGDPEKTRRFRKQLPDAVYTPWSRIRGSLKRALDHPPDSPVVPASRMAGYSGTPLPRKLGIKEGSVVALIRAPEDFDQTLGDLPPGVKLRPDGRGRFDVAIWFVRSLKELNKRLPSLARRINENRMWIAWLKKASGIATDVTERHVRQAGLSRGLVDYKICAVDANWSGLLFTRRRSKG